MLFCPDRLPLAILSLFVLLALSAAPAFAGQQKARVWVADSLTKILPVMPAPAQSPAPPTTTQSVVSPRRSAVARVSFPVTSSDS